MQAGGSPTPPTPTIPYQKVEYLIGNGNGACLDTGIVPNSDYTVKCKFIFFGTLGRNTHLVFGSGAGPASQNIELYNSYSYPSMLEVHYAGVDNIGRVVVGNYYTIVQEKGVITIYNSDGTINSTSNFGVKSFNCPYSMYLFALHRSNILKFSGLVGIQTFQLIDGNNTIVADYTAVRDNGVGYMYDSVTQTLIGSATATAFPYGNDIN